VIIQEIIILSSQNDWRKRRAKAKKKTPDLKEEKKTPDLEE
jgi:hypothetical protein